MLIIHNSCLYLWTFSHKITDVLSLTDQFGVLKYIVFILTFSKFEISNEHHQRAHCEQYNTNCIGLLNSDFVSLPVYIWRLREVHNWIKTYTFVYFNDSYFLRHCMCVEGDYHVPMLWFLSVFTFVLFLQSKMKNYLIFDRTNDKQHKLRW
jgi:hypothetical protein